MAHTRQHRDKDKDSEDQVHGRIPDTKTAEAKNSAFVWLILNIHYSPSEKWSGSNRTGGYSHEVGTLPKTTKYQTHR